MNENFSMEKGNPFLSMSKEEISSVLEQTSELEAQNNQEFRKIFEDECLEFLKTKDSEFFYRNYNGDRDDDGYLFDKDGKPTSFLPSQNINIHRAEVAKIALQKFSETQKN